MKTTATFATTASACAFIALALATTASAGGPKPGLYLNGPALDGQKVALPGTPAEDEYQGKGMNGPALNGQKVALPDGQALGRSWHGNR